MRIHKTGYRTSKIFSDLALGIMDGLESAIWAYVFATIVFAGALSLFLPIGLTVILCGWAIASLAMIALSRVEVHLVCTNEQAVIILGAIGALMVTYMGEDATSSKGLSTVLAVIAATSFLAALSFYLVARLHLTHVLSMVPYPVVCGYMVGIVWLFLDAGTSLTTGASVSADLFTALTEGNNALKLALAVAGGLALCLLSNRIDSPWVLPIMAVLFVATFYGGVGLAGTTREELVNGGWLVDINTDVGGIGGFLEIISPTSVDLGFILSVLPEIAAIIFITTLTAAMEVSVLSALNYRLNVQTEDEMMNNSVGLMTCALLCSPPAVTDAAASEIYKNFGASSRWMQVGSCAVLLAVVPIGTSVIAYVPTVLLGAVVFLVAFQMFFDWMYTSMRELANEDRGIILLILGTVIAFGFVEGVLLGILVTALLFVLRYSFISAIHGEYNLGEFRSSVEWSGADNAALNKHADEALILTLRGFLFFGTSNTIRNTLFDRINVGRYSAILLDLRRVTGIDGSAMQVFRQIYQLCDANGVRLLYSGVSDIARNRLIAVGGVGEQDGKALLFSDIDFAVEWLESELLARHTDQSQTSCIRTHLESILGDPVKVELLMGVLKLVKIEKGDTLLRQGDADNGLYVVESGTLTALVEAGDGTPIRVKKFSPGALVGELSGYTAHKTRTATIVAGEPSVLYHLDMSSIMADPKVTGEVISAVHEMVARTLSTRLEFMNRRLIKEIC